MLLRPAPEIGRQSAQALGHRRNTFLLAEHPSLCARETLLTEPMLPFAQTKMMRSCLLLLTACFRSAYAVQCCNAEHKRCDAECTACASCSGWGCLACGHCIPCTPYIECGPYSNCHTGMYIGLGVGAPALTHFSE